MPTYARGSKALGICDRTGFVYKLSELVYETKNGTRTGLRVGKDIADGDHPQNFLGRLRIVDPQSLREPRPDVNREESVGLFGWRPVGHPETRLVGAVGSVTVAIVAAPVVFVNFSPADSDRLIDASGDVFTVRA